MPANVENMVYAGAVPWHGLGTAVTDEAIQKNAHDFMIAGGADWEVGLKSIQTFDGISLKALGQATYRVSDGRILGLVGPRYHVLQNADAFNWFQPFLDSGDCLLHTAGSLDNGKKVWALAELCRKPMEIAKRDEVKKFILLSNSHDGTQAIRVGFTPIRVVCANTLAMAHNLAESTLLRIRHSRNAIAALETARDIMNLVDAKFEATAEQYRFLASKQVCESDLRKYIKVVLGLEATPEVDIPTRSKNIIDQIINTAIGGAGNNLPGVAGTYWAAYNAFTEYFSWEKGRSVDTRFNSLWFGANATLNRKALDVATTLAA